MKNLIQKHKTFFLLFAIFIVGSLVILTQINQGDLILFFSENRTPFWNFFFKYGTMLGEEIAYAVIGIILLFIRFRLAILVGITGFVVMGISFILKTLFAADRPFTFFDKLAKIDQIIPVEGVKFLVGPTSFPSGHTMSAFALYLMLTLISPPKKRFAFLFFSMALTVGISRIWLVQHFLRDVTAGAFCGVLIGAILYYFNQKYPYNSKYWIDRSLLDLRNPGDRRKRAS